MNNKTFFYLLIAFLAVFVGSGVSLLFSNKNADKTTSGGSNIPTTQEEMITPKIVMTEGSMKLALDQLKTSYKKGDKINISIEADSGDKNIVGYDVILFYDPLAFEFISAISSISDYKVYSLQKENYLTLTAVKNLSSTSSPLLSKIVTLVFDSRKSGKYNFTLKASTGSERTDLVTDKTEVLSPALNEITVNVN